MSYRDLDKRRATQRAYYARNAERERARQAAYRAEHPELVAEKKREYEKAHPEQKSASFRRVYLRKQERIREFKDSSGGCRDCSVTDVRVLTLHHRDREDKNPRLRGPKRISITALSWADLETELAKCDVLCANCHIVETWHEESSS